MTEDEKPGRPAQMQTESGNRTEYRDIMSDSLLQELTIRK